MVDLAEIQAAYYMVAATGVLVAAIYYMMTLRTTQRNMKMNLETRQAQLLMSILNRWTECARRVSRHSPWRPGS